MSSPEDRQRALEADAWMAAEFDRCSHWLQAALDTSPFRSHTLQHVWEALKDGSAQIWPTPNSVCLTEIKVYPTGLKVLLGWLAGGDLDEVKATTRMLEGYAKSVGCDATAVQGRRGWLRAFEGYRDAGSTIVKGL